MITTSIEALKRLATYPLDAMLQEVGPQPPANSVRSSDAPRMS